MVAEASGNGPHERALAAVPVPALEMAGWAPILAGRVEMKFPKVDVTQTSAPTLERRVTATHVTDATQETGSIPGEQNYQSHRH